MNGGKKLELSPRALAAIFLGGVLVNGGHAFAYGSKCYIAPGSSVECGPGPDAVRNKSWLGFRAEHTELFQKSLESSGLPSAIGEPFDLSVFTDGSEITLAGVPVPTARASTFKAGLRAEFVRTTRTSELAQLPDFAYSLWDWASGNETCPLNPQLPGPVGAVACHQFEGHMGAANANHFVPQSQSFYSHYHGLALARAQACQEMQDALGAELSRFEAYVEECEKEAFALEGVAHHFLQDAWSSGHMWERWGSPDPADYASLHEAVIVGLTSGLIHGARDSLTKYEGSAVVFDDPLCAPHPDVRWVSGAGLGPFAGVGDLYLDELLLGGPVITQRSALFDCAVSSLRQVYDALGPTPIHGNAGPPDGNVVISLDPNSADCFGQRATNEALNTGAGLDYTVADGTHNHLPLLSFAGLVLPLAGNEFGAGLDPIGLYDPGQSLVAYNLDLIEAGAKLAFYGTFFPDETGLASGGLPELLGMKPNSAYAEKNPLSGYVDPALPWSPAGDAKAAELARVFHRAHAKEWCETVAPGHPTFDLEDLRQTVQSTAPDTPAREAACTACETFMQRHVRVGTNESDYDQNLEPLCFYLAPASAQFVYANPESPGSDAVFAAAELSCGCAPVDPEPSQDGVIFRPPPRAGSPYPGLICQVGESATLTFYLADPITGLPIANEPAELVAPAFGGPPLPDSVAYELVAPTTDASGRIDVRGTAVMAGASNAVTLRFPFLQNQPSIQVSIGLWPAPVFMTGDGYPGGLSPGAYLDQFDMPVQILDVDGAPVRPIVTLEFEDFPVAPRTLRWTFVPGGQPPPWIDAEYYDWFQGGYYALAQSGATPQDYIIESPPPFTQDLGADFQLVYPHPTGDWLIRLRKLNNTWSTFRELRTRDFGCGPEGFSFTYHRLNP